jgi:hypothetical protein
LTSYTVSVRLQCTMPNFRFSIRDVAGNHRENAGWMALDDDYEATIFGKAVIQDLLHGNAMRYAGWIMDVTDGERAVCSISIV